MLTGTTSLDLVALHEAGHAVAHVRLQIPQLRASIIEAGDTVGSVRSQCEVWSRDEAAAMAIAYCSGYAALVAAGLAETEASAGCDSDFRCVQDLVVAWQLEGGLDQIKSAAVSMMIKPENSSAVSLVARELLANRTLDDDVIDLLVDVADGHCSRDAFDRFLVARASPPLEG
ncbi:hypothetical protein SNE35_18830 [Paucibacter sp. R3-3]|uniref:Peptidase M41 domain-containing protein n=1 Tax=Roseateles agri TaxID=3098619 RepID=A0ABU5DJV0_9BURK|nr:hypothetical protein [Paucibacter sp. R3-3]MDY0746576.1 hypothetical protein [Paucibacter sp. R3-3]